MTALASATANTAADALSVEWTLNGAVPNSGTVVLTAGFGGDLVGAKFLNGNKIAQYVTVGGTQLNVAGDVSANGASVRATYPISALNGLDTSAKGTASVTAAGAESTAPLA